MKKFYLIALLCFLIGSSISAQSFKWAKREGLYEYDYGYGMAHDNKGMVYVAGKYEQAANFSGTTLPNKGNHDIYVAQYDSMGNLKWIHTGGGPHGDYAHAMACNKTNAVYIAGEIEGFETVTFDDNTTTLTPQGENDAFVAKYDLSGTLLWAKSAGGVGNDKAQGVSYDAAGNVYITGKFTKTASFGGTSITSAGAEDIFIAKYDANGNFLWVRSAGGPGLEEAQGMVCDADGNSYICGRMSNGAMFGSNTAHTFHNTSFLDGFVAKYDKDGNALWVKTVGGDVDDDAWSIAQDEAGKIYITGEYNAYAEFGGSTFALTSAGMADVFVACFDASGTPQWAKTMGGKLIDRARGITCSGSEVYITGQYGGTGAKFGSQTFDAADSSDVFVCGLDNTGNVKWTVVGGGAADAYEDLGFESGIAVTEDGNGSLYATGSLLDGGSFGGTSLSPYAHTDMFITRLALSGALDHTGNGNGNSAITHMNGKGSFLVYPNPGKGTFRVSVPKTMEQDYQINVYNSLGQLITNEAQKASVQESTITLQNKGMYFIKILSKNGDYLDAQKLIVN